MGRHPTPIAACDWIRLSASAGDAQEQLLNGNNEPIPLLTVPYSNEQSSLKFLIGSQCCKIMGDGKGTLYNGKSTEKEHFKKSSSPIRCQQFNRTASAAVLKSVTRHTATVHIGCVGWVWVWMPCDRRTLSSPSRDCHAVCPFPVHSRPSSSRRAMRSSVMHACNTG